MSPAGHYRSTDTPDGAGGYTREWLQLDDPVDVSYGIPSPAERAVAEQDGVEFDYVLKVPAGVDVRRGDRLVVDGLTIEATSSATSSQTAVQQLRGKLEPWDEPST